MSGNKTQAYERRNETSLNNWEEPSDKITPEFYHGKRDVITT
jgi:hypothetical protein